MKKPIISIIIPAYNIEDYIGRCLESIKKQSFINFEAIVVDDGSSDKSFAIAEEYAKNDKRFKAIKQKNNGQGSARNHGIELSQGEYLAFVDSDDWVHEDYLAKLYAAILQCEADIVVCNVERVWDTGKRKSNNSVYRRAESITNTIEYIPRASMAVWDKLYKASLFEGLRFPENMKFEDFALMPQVLIRARKIAVIEDVLYYYFWRDGSTTNQKRINRDILKAQYILEESELKEKCPEMLQTLFIKNVMGSLIWGILKENDPYDEVANIMKEGMQKYPDMDICDFGTLMGNRKIKYGYYLLQGQYKRARNCVLLYEFLVTAIKKMKKLLKI